MQPKMWNVEVKSKTQLPDVSQTNWQQQQPREFAHEHVSHGTGSFDAVKKVQPAKRLLKHAGQGHKENTIKSDTLQINFPSGGYVNVQWYQTHVQQRQAQMQLEQLKQQQRQRQRRRQQQQQRPQRTWQHHDGVMLICFIFSEKLKVQSETNINIQHRIMIIVT